MEATIVYTKMMIVVFCLTLAACSGSPTSPSLGLDAGAPGATAQGFDAAGYNRTAMIFVGPYDGIDGIIDGAAYGDPTFANDRLNLNWNAEYDRGNVEGWSNPPYTGARLTNAWNGKAAGTGQIWHYRFDWVGPCGADGTPTPGGGECIWSEFQVTMSHGSIDGTHFWAIHAKRKGFIKP